MTTPPRRPAARRPCPPLQALMALMASLTLMAGPTVVLAQSAVSPGPTTGPRFDQLVSDDGRLTLSVPFGAGPDISTLSIVPVLVTVPAIAAYELRPLGTSFPVPVTASWQSEPLGVATAANGQLVWLGMARTGVGASDAATGPWEWITDAHVTVVDGDYRSSGLLTRFGTLIVTQLPTLVHGPEAIWGPGYAPGRGIEVPLDLTLAAPGGAPGTSAFSGDWRFGGGYPDLIDVTATVAEADRLSAVWRCLRRGTTSLSMTFGVREGTTDTGPTSRLPGLGPAMAAFSVEFPVACGAVHANPDG